MRFGVILPIQLKDTSLDDHFEELREEVAVAEEAGFDAVFLPEFHQARGGALVSPLLVGAALLQGTSADPLRLRRARDAAPPSGAARRGRDHVRLDHARPARARARDRPPGARLQGLRRPARRADRGVRGGARPARALLRRRAVPLRGQALHERGAHHAAAVHAAAPRDLDRRPLAVRPRARGPPRPTCGSPTRSATCRRSRSSPSPTAVTPRSSARRRASASSARRGSATARRSASGSGRPTRCRCTGSTTTSAPTRSASSRGSTRSSSGRTSRIDRLAPGRFLYGSPEDVRAEVEEWRELTGCEYLALRFRHPGGPSHAETMEALRRFGAEVIMPLTAETTTTGARP